MKYCFRVADITFDVEMDFSIDWNPYIKRYIVEDSQDTMYHYKCRVCDRLPEPIGRELYHTDNQFIYISDGGLEERLHLMPLYGYPLILYRELDRYNRNLYINNEYLELLVKPSSFNIFNALAAERFLIEQEAFVLHSSFIIHEGYAILFTAPSGTGKSTQGDLWVKYQGATLVNGDRTLIRKKDGVWCGYGFPICGSSNVCRNESAPIRAVVYLGQAMENCAVKMPVAQAIKKLISETSINFWNQNFVDAVVRLLSDFCGDIEVHHYTCTKEREATDYLKEYLEGRDHESISDREYNRTDDM